MSNWFKCDPTDFLDGLETCDSPEQAAVYVACIFRMYASRGPIPNNPASIAPFAKIGPTKCRKVILELVDMGKIELIGDRLFNARVRAEIGHQKEVSEARAKAGKEGGRASKKSSKTSGKVAAESPQNGGGIDSAEGLSKVSDEKMAENGRPPQAIASLDREIDRKNPPKPPTDHAARMRAEFAEFKKTLPPADAQPVDKGERDRILNRVSSLSSFGDADPDDEPIVRELTSFIMREAAMVMPPADLALVGGWVRQGASPDRIRVTIARLCANAKGPIRGMRYFDRTIREEMQAETDADAALMRHFEAIAARAKADRATDTQH